jgi:hypothetical protein
MRRDAIFNNLAPFVQRCKMVVRKEFALVILRAFLGGERRPSSIENKKFSLLPYVPGSNDEDLHEEGIMVLLF